MTLERLLEALDAPPPVDVELLARATPVAALTLPLAVVALPDGVAAAARVDPEWLGEVDRRRAASRHALVAAGRGAEMEAALQTTIVRATERFDPADDTDVDAHVASGARLWLLTGAAVSALTGVDPDPFEPWALLVAAGWWPVGPCDGRLVVSEASRRG